MSTVWEDTNDCARQYMRALATYLMTVLSSSYGIIIYLEINAPGHGSIFLAHSMQLTNFI